MKKYELISLVKTLMKNFLYPFLIVIAFTYMASATSLKAQDILNRPVSITAKNKYIKTIIEILETHANVKFVYGSKSIEVLRKVSINASKQKLSDFLEQYFEPYDIGFKLVDDRILLYSISAAKQNGFILSRPEMHRDASISGKVTDGNGKAIPGASVTIKGKNIGVTTDGEGKFTIKNLAAGTYTVVVSYVGFISREISVDINDQNKTIDVILAEDNLQLESVVVTGGGNPKTKLESSVALTSVSKQDIVNRAPLNSIDLLKAVPGLTVESTGGDGPGNVWVRGFPQQGGYIYLGIQEDGLPLLPTGFNSMPSVDQYYKTDLTIQNIEAIRGGNASIIQYNTPGAVVNNISYAGADKPYGTFKFTTGFSQGLYRFDGNTGGKINDNIKYNIGGFYRTDKGVVNPGYSPANAGGQVKGNMTFNFANKKGFIRVKGKYLNDITQWLLPAYYSYDGTGKPNAYKTFDIVTQSMSPIDTKWSYTDQYSNQSYSFSLNQGMHTKLGSGAVEFNYATDNGWRISNNFKYQKTATGINASLPLAISSRDASQYYYVDGTKASADASDQVISAIAFARLNNDKQIVDYLDFKKQANNHSIFFGAGIHQYNRDDLAYTFSYKTEFKENPRLLTESATPTTENGRKLGQKNTTIGNTRALSLYAGDEWEISEKLRLDIGARIDNQNVTGKRPYYGVKADGAPDNKIAANKNILGYTDYNISATNWAVSVGANYKMSNASSTFLRLTKAYNMPNINDYSAVAYNPANIKDRPVYLAELGYKYAKNNLGVFLSGSYSVIKNVSLAINVPIPGSGLQALLAFGSTKTWSAEWEISYKIFRPLTLRWIGTVQDSRYTDYSASTKTNSAVVAQYGDKIYSFTGNRTERVPALNSELSGTIDYQNFNFFLSASYIGNRYTSASNSYKLPGYVAVKAGAGYNFTKAIALRLWADNLTNARVLTEGDVRGDQFRDFSKVTPGTLMPGRTLLQRTFFGSLAYSF